ncbi:P-II family nitrogen regulator [Desulfitobacterium chlororespirans]|uniref:Nitrogen regulatory protein P-II family n=1 Tax=Desulfitobacterium chlororespirans DSM 11544 TaxID=1121395 RepID=A0A1M7TRK3_9FIRM|nr:P-II family nitrogen regulator [Desulfitobacterium chlororespirans]SHN73310.1 nitrogen regulatory protein P-II family [Desulfitobacterium chlororespirans DSM 11544]
MKEVIAIIRPKMVAKTKAALEAIGINSITAIPVLGRGKQRGIMGEVDIEYRPQIGEQAPSRGMKYIPKRQISVVVQDQEVDTVVQAIIQVNKTGQFGDGKIFECPVDEALRVRTGETGAKAIL